MRYPPGPKSILGCYFSLRRDPLAFLVRIARRHGNLVHMRWGNRRDFLLNHPDYIKQVLSAKEGLSRSSLRSLRKLLGAGLLTSDGEFHHRNRRMIAPVLGRKHSATWAAAIVEHSVRLGRGWHTGQTVDIDQQMARLALTNILKLLLSPDIDTEGLELLRALGRVTSLANQNTFPSLTELLLSVPTNGHRRLERATAELDAVVHKIIAQRRTGNPEAQYMLASMLALRDKFDSTGMSDRQLRDEVITLMVAGQETMGSALTWTWYLIAQHPAVEARLHVELDTVLGGRLPTMDDLPRLSYTEMVLLESMRLYPPVWVFTRRPLQDYELGGYDIPAGSFLQLSPYVTHRDPRYFPEPELFDPERWQPDRIAARNHYTYFPFAGGIHRCIGEGVAMSEGVLTLATLAQQYRLRLPSGYRARPVALITIRPKNGLPMIVEARQNGGARP